MSDHADRIRRQMRSIRREVGADVDGIVHSAHELSDWRYYVGRYPWLCVGSAFAVGVLAAPRRRELLKRVNDLDLKALLGQAGLAASAGVSGGTGGLAMKVLAFIGPIAARSAAAMIARRMGGSPPADDGDKSYSEYAGKPR